MPNFNCFIYKLGAVIIVILVTNFDDRPKAVQRKTKNSFIFSELLNNVSFFFFSRKI